MAPFPTQMHHDLLTGGTGLDIVDETGQDRTVSSLQEIRTIENRSLRKSRNGEGEPVVFRGFSQNKGNRDVNTLAGTPYERNKSVPLAELKRATRAGPIRARARDEPKV